MALGLGLGLSRSSFVAESALLDTYSSAAAAYSLRKLRTAYSGSAIRVRRSSDNTEQDIGFTASGDLDQSALTTFTGANDGFVVTWYDQSGNGLDVSAPADTNEPQIVSSGTVILESGKPAISFDGSNDILEDTVSLDISGGVSTFSVVSGWSTGAILSLNSDATTTDELLEWVSSGSQVARYNASPSTGAGDTNDLTQQLFTVIVNGSTPSLDVYRDGSSIASFAPVTAGIATAIRLRIGSRNTSNLPTDASIQEVIIYTADKSSQRTGIESNINAGW